MPVARVRQLMAETVTPVRARTLTAAVHFLALNAMQALMGLRLERRCYHGRGVMLAAAGCAALTLVVCVQALMGLPLWRL